MGRRKDPDRTRELLDSCCDFVEAQGLGDFTLRPLAAAIGVSPRTLLYHFGSREQLLILAIQRSRERRLNSAAAMLARPEAVLGAGDASAGFGSVIESIAASMWEESISPEARPFFLLFYEAYAMTLRHPNRYQKLLDQLSGEAHTLINNALTGVGMSAAAASAVASELIGTHRGLQLEWLATGRTEELAAAHRTAMSRIADAVDQYILNADRSRGV
jgi:AcrR family transcriptional regulator